MFYSSIEKSFQKSEGYKQQMARICPINYCVNEQDGQNDTKME